MKEKQVAAALKNHFSRLGLETERRFDAFNQQDDLHERTLIIDFVVSPLGTRGIRTYQEILDDQQNFKAWGEDHDQLVKLICRYSIFPGHGKIDGFIWKENPNPLVGIAIEIENNFSKYFLGSLLASSVIGRWGIVVVNDNEKARRWCESIKRMIHKGSPCPIPSNTMIILRDRLYDVLRDAPARVVAPPSP